MNALGVSVVFVLCSILLSFVKDLVFSDPEPPKSIIKFNKVLELSNNKTEKVSQHYKSLYQAYHRHQFFDPQKSSKLIQNRHEFNQSVLTESLNNQQSSLMCGADFLVLVFSGVSIDNLDRVQFVNTFHVFRLPLMAKIKQISVNGKIVLPLQCKRNTVMNDLQYEIGVMSKEALYLLRIYENSAHISYTKTRQQTKDQSNIDKFDFYGNWFTYCTQDRPWIVRLENLLFHDQVIEINLLTQINQIKSSIPQQINVKYLLLGQSQQLYLGIVYQHLQYGGPTKNISLLTYLIKDNIATQLRKRTIDYNIPANGHTISQCKIYTNQKSLKYDLSCLITKSKQNKIKYVNYEDVFKPYKKPNDNLNNAVLENQYQEQEQKGWIQDYLYSFIDDDEDQYQELIENNQRQQQKQKNLSSYFLMTATLVNPTYQLKKIVKHSAPTPILYYQKDHKHYLYSMAFPNDLQQFQLTSIPSITYELNPPSFNKSQPSLRDIKWVNNESFVVIIWTTAIEVYEYSCTNLPDKDAAGITMSIILPFIQLFATVYCILRVVWIND